MSYNLLLDTGFNRIDKHWKLTNCSYENGYLKSTAKIYSIELEIILPDPTHLYFSIEYIAKSKDIKSVYVGILTGDVLEATKKNIRLNKRVRLSVIDKIKCEKVKVMFIVEAETENSNIYIDSPLLVDLIANNKNYWPKTVLSKILDYRLGYNYENLYKETEISLQNTDFRSVATLTELAKSGILAHVKTDDWFHILYPFKANTYYLIKLDYQELNQYGELYLKYGDRISTTLKDLLYILFKGSDSEKLMLYVKNSEVLPYLINLKHVLIIDLTNTKLTEDDIIHLPFI